jgi:hypothetical protein
MNANPTLGFSDDANQGIYKAPPGAVEKEEWSNPCKEFHPAAWDGSRSIVCMTCDFLYEEHDVDSRD